MSVMWRRLTRPVTSPQARGSAAAFKSPAAAALTEATSNRGPAGCAWALLKPNVTKQPIVVTAISNPSSFLRVVSLIVRLLIGIRDSCLSILPENAFDNPPATGPADGVTL